MENRNKNRHLNPWEKWTDFRNVAMFWLLGLALLTLLSMVVNGQHLDWQNIGENFSTGLVQTTITFLILDKIIQKREENYLQQSLIRDMGSRDNGIAQRAVRELRVMPKDREGENWLQDGTLNRVALRRANLQFTDLNGADLSYAQLSGAKLSNSTLSGAILEGAALDGVDFQWADLYRCNLAHAQLNKANFLNASFLMPGQLAHAQSLSGAIMPNGTRYDGRYRLFGDLVSLMHFTLEDVSIKDLWKNDVVMANLYTVSLDQYQIGQNWADNHLEEVKAFWARIISGSITGGIEIAEFLDGSIPHDITRTYTVDEKKTMLQRLGFSLPDKDA